MRSRRCATLLGVVLALVLTGAVHAATIVGGSAKDVIRGTAKADELYGFAGSDRMIGGRGPDVLVGGGGHDLLEGGPGNDVLLGGKRNDKLVGGPGRNSLLGGPGADLVIAKNGARDFVDCGLGKDQIVRDPFDHVENCEKRKVKTPAGGYGGNGGATGSGGSGGSGSPPPPPPPPPPAPANSSKLTVRADAGGTVTSTPAGIACPGRCTAHFAPGAKVSLRANPANNRSFTRWGGSCSGPQVSCSLTLTRDRWVRAMFAGPNPSASPPPPPPPSPAPPPPPPSPPPPPPPPGGSSIVTSTKWTCTGPVNLTLLKVTLRSGGDAVSLDSGCTGRIGRIEIETWSEDGVKIQNSSSNAAHDLVIGSGYIKCHAIEGGAHQDGVQAMGGARVTFRGVSIDCLGNSNFFVTEGGGGATRPTDVVCEGCVLGPRSSTTIRVNNATRSGARNSALCPGRNMTVFWGDPSSINVGNTMLLPTDARCR